MLGHDVAGDPEDPARERPRMLIAKVRKALPRREEDVLGGILGVLGSAESGVRVANNPLPVSFEEFSECIDLTTARPLNEVLKRGRASQLLPLYR